MPTRSSLCQALLLSWLDRDAQADAFAWIVGHDARVVAAAVVIRDLVARVARFPMVDLAALLDGLFLHAALVVVLVVDTVADDGAGKLAGRPAKMAEKKSMPHDEEQITIKACIPAPVAQSPATILRCSAARFRAPLNIRHHYGAASNMRRIDTYLVAAGSIRLSTPCCRIRQATYRHLTTL